MDVLNEKQKEFFKQYIEKYDIKREGDGFWKLVEIQMALKTGNSFDDLKVLTEEDYSSEQLEQGRIAIDDGIPLDIIRTFYKKENSAEEMRKAREDFIFNKKFSEQQTEQNSSVMEMSDAEYLTKYLPAENHDENKGSMEKLEHLEKVVLVLERRLTEFKDSLEESSTKVDIEYQKELNSKEEIISSLKEQLKDYKKAEENWKRKEMQYKREFEKYHHKQQYEEDIKQKKDDKDKFGKISVKDRIALFFNDRAKESERQILENIIIKGDLSAEQLQVINEIVNELSAKTIKKIANKKYSAEKMQQLIRFYQSRKQDRLEAADLVLEGEAGKKGFSENMESPEQMIQGMYEGEAEHKYDDYEEGYDSYNEDYGESYSDDYQEEYEEDDE